MTKKLIVNADDFGLSRGINYGIIEAHRHGLVTSTTAMMNAGAIEHAAQLSADFPSLDVGLHFVLSYGSPLSAMPSLTREGALGKWLWRIAEEGKLNDAEVAEELRQQYTRFVALFGRAPTHIDSHHHAHLIPSVWKLVTAFAQEKGLPVRIDHSAVRAQNLSVQGVKGVEGFISDFYGENATPQFLLNALSHATRHGEQSVELMCHPGYVDNVTRQSRYCDPRLTELAVLTAPEIKQAVSALGFQPATWRDL